MLEQVELEGAPSRSLAPTAATLRAVAAFALVPNLVFWLLGRRLYLMRPAFNVDYLLIGIAGTRLPRWATTLLFGLELLLDAVVNVAPAFHFELVHFVRALADVVHLAPGYAVPVTLGLLAACAAIAVGATRFLARSLGRPEAAALLALTVLVSAADVVNGSSFLPLAVKQSFLDFNLANSASVKTGFALLSNLRHSRRSAFTPLQPGESATWPLLAAARDASRPLPPWQLGVVGVESLGLFREPALQARLLAPLTSDAIRARYQVELGAVPFHGVTVDGEFRELCGVRLGWLGPEVPQCLPALLRARGYQTVALHGFTSAFYDRARWYPQIGFERALFAQQLRARGLTRTCGSGFEGLCDVDVARAFGEELRAGTAEHPRLVYWMTLNSHTPLRAADADGSGFDCAASPATAGDTTLCLQAKILWNALDAVAKVALDPALPRTELVVVGDHAPPNLSRERRDLYDQERVPFVRLVPR